MTSSVISAFNKCARSMPTSAVSGAPSREAREKRSALLGTIPVHSRGPCRWSGTSIRNRDRGPRRNQPAIGVVGSSTSSLSKGPATSAHEQRGAASAGPSERSTSRCSGDIEAIPRNRGRATSGPGTRGRCGGYDDDAGQECWPIFADGSFEYGCARVVVGSGYSPPVLLDTVTCASYSVRHILCATH